MKKIIIFSLIIFSSFCSNLMSQETYIAINWDTNFATGDLKDFLQGKGTSLKGASVDYRYIISKKLSVGAYFGWDFFSTSSTGLSRVESTDISGKKDFFVNYFPIMVSGHYYLNEISNITPYFGAQLGLVRTLQRTTIGSFEIQNNNWHFGFAPEAGISVPFSKSFGIKLSAKYNYTPSTGDSIDYSFLSINLGVFNLW